MFVLFFFIFQFFISSSKALALDLGCLHPQVCLLLQTYLKKTPLLKQEVEKKNLTLSPLLQRVSDFHSFSPTPSETKELLKKDILFTPPLPLASFLGKIQLQRKGVTLSLDLPLWDFKKGDTSLTWTQESVAHFWTHPDFLCQSFKNMKSLLLSQKLSTSSHYEKELTTVTEELCEEASQLKKDLQKTLRSLKGVQWVLTHDSFLPFLLSEEQLVFSLFSSHHLDHLGALERKKLENLKKSKTKALWLEEREFHKWASLQNLLDFMPNVQINTHGSFREDLDSFSVLREFLQKIQSLKNFNSPSSSARISP